MSAATEPGLDGAALAWVLERATFLDLPRDRRDAFDDLARHIAQVAREAPDTIEGLHEGCADADELDDLKMEIVDLRVVDGIVANIFGEHDSEDLDAAIRARLEAERAEGHKDALVPSRSDARSKALRLLIEGRLDVTRHDVAGDHAGLIVATCRGDSGTVYRLGYDPRPNVPPAKRWRCTCQELRGNCSHLAALKLITTVQPEGGTT